MLRAIMDFRHADDTQSMNDRFTKLFAKGIYFGGLLQPVAGKMQVTIDPFWAISEDGMTVIESSTPTTVPALPDAIPQGSTTYICLRAKYSPNSEPVMVFEALEANEYNSKTLTEQKEYIVFGTVSPPAPPPTMSQIDPDDIHYELRDVVDQVGRSILRGVIPSTASLPATGNVTGDAYIIASGVIGSNPEMDVWNGHQWVNITTATAVLALLNQHRQNLFSNEIHMTDKQTEAVSGFNGRSLSGYEPSTDLQLHAEYAGFIYLQIKADGDAFFHDVGLNRSVCVSGTAIAAELESRIQDLGGLYAEVKVDWNNINPGRYTIISSEGGANSKIEIVSYITTAYDIAADLKLGVSNGGIELTGITAELYNQFVLETDERVLRYDHAKAAFGSDGLPNDDNRFITQEKVWAVQKELTNPESLPLADSKKVVLPPNKYFVGLGSAGSSTKFFRISDPTIVDGEYLNSSKEGVFVTEVRQQGAISALDPSSLVGVDVDTNGFYIGTTSLVLIVNANINTSYDVLCAVSGTFKDIELSAFIDRGPRTPQANWRTMEMYYEIGMMKQHLKIIEERRFATYNLSSDEMTFATPFTFSSNNAVRDLEVRENGLPLHHDDGSATDGSGYVMWTKVGSSTISIIKANRVGNLPIPSGSVLDIIRIGSATLPF